MDLNTVVIAKTNTHCYSGLFKGWTIENPV